MKTPPRSPPGPRPRAAARPPAIARRQTAPAIEWFGAAGDGLRQPTRIARVALSRNGRFAATSDAQCVIRVFDLEAQRCVAEVKVPSKWKARFDRLRALSVSDDARLVLGRVDRGFVLGDPRDWAPVFKSEMDSPATAMPDGRRWARLMGSIALFEADEKRGEYREKDRGARAFDVLPDGRIVAVFTKSHDDTGVLRILSPALESLASIEIAETMHQARVGFVDDRHVVALTPDGRLHEWDVKARRLRSTTLRGGFSDATLLAPVRAVIADGDDLDEPYRVLRLDTDETACTTTTTLWAASADGRVLVSAEGATLALRDPSTFAELGAAPALRTPVRAVAFDSSGDRLWSADDERALRWSVRDRRIEATVATPENRLAVGLTAEGGGLLLSDHDGGLACIALPSGKRRGEVSGGPRFPAVGHDGELVATVAGDAVRVTTWAGATRATWPRPAPISAIAFSPDKKLVVVCHQDSRVQVRRLAAKPELVSAFAVERFAFSMVVSPGGDRLAMCSDSPTVHVYALPGGELLHRLRLPKRTIAPVAISPDGRWVASSDKVSTLVWDLRSGERHLALKAGANSLAFSPSGEQLAIGGHGALGLVSL